MTERKVEAHQQSEVDTNTQLCRALAPKIAAELGVTISVALVADDAEVPPGSKKVNFIRHGEGHHNVAQREWRAQPDWDGTSEPYTIDNDASFRYVDALLTDKGEGQARTLQARTTIMARPQLLVVSPLRRATQTSLIAFAPHVEASKLPTVAHELCHEIGGRHTCDKRLSRAELEKQYPAVSYALLETEDDPHWLDGVTRESWESLALRGAGFATWLRGRPETHIAVAAHSAFLLATFNAVFTAETEEARGWFGTGEMRTVLLSWK